MPEGPTIVLFREELEPIVGQRVMSTGGSIKSIDPARLEGHRIQSIDTWGKYLYLLLDGGLSMRMHFGMFGVFYFDVERPGKTPKLVLHLSGGKTLRFYATSMKYDQPLPLRTVILRTPPI